MNIDWIVKNPDAAHHYAERYVNFQECFIDKFRGDLQKIYSSYDGEETMKLAYLLLPTNKLMHNLTVFRNPLLENKVDNYFFGEDFVRFPVHPQILEEKDTYLKQLVKESIGTEFVNASPTASMRTVFIDEPIEMYIKTHFPKRISSSKRHVGLIDIQRGMWISEQISMLQNRNMLPETIGFLPDIAGMFFSPDDAGAIIRDSSAIHPTKGGYVLPLASLFAPDKNRPDDALIIEQLAQHYDKTVENYVSDTILPPHINGWFWLMNEMGTVFTPHGQNALVEFDSNHSFVRYIHRDFQGKRVLPTILNSKNIALPDHSTEKEKTLEESLHLSLSYDLAIGKIFYDRMIGSLNNKGYATSKIIDSIKDLFNSNNHNNEIHFNKTQVMYTFERGYREVIDTGEKPKYR